MYRIRPWFCSKHGNYNKPHQCRKVIFRELLHFGRGRYAYRRNQNLNWNYDYSHCNESWSLFVNRNLFQARSAQSAVPKPYGKVKNSQSDENEKEVSHSGNVKDMSTPNKVLNDKRKAKKLVVHPIAPSFTTLLEKVFNTINQSKPNYFLNELDDCTVVNKNTMIENLESQGPVLVQCHEHDNLLYNEFLRKQNSKASKKMMQYRKKLPCYKIKSNFLDLLSNNQVVIVSGSTGCGKSTQLVQYVLDDFIKSKRGSLCNIVCIVPRRVCAISLASRISNERCETMSNSIGYQVRLNNSLARRKTGCINFLTTGIFLQGLLEPNFLQQFSHIFIDEVHERSTDSDFIMAILKLVLPKLPELKVVLMSATINADLFSSYMNGAPHLKVDGRLYPVKDYYLEDILKKTKFEFVKTKCKNDITFANTVLPYVGNIKANMSYPRYVTRELEKPVSETINNQLISELIRYIVNNENVGCILIFLPGLSDIIKLEDFILASSWYNKDKFIILKMHSVLSKEEQEKIFISMPEDVWKIVISTSILETSVTINDVKYVIDSGKIKGLSFDMKEKTSLLKPVWISKSNALQRKGRAGRVQEGKCFKLYSRAREKSFPDFPTPEFLCVSLEQKYMMAKSLNVSCVKKFFDNVLDPPVRTVIDASIKFLQKADILDSDENLTPLGYHVSKIPVAPLLGKLLIMGAVFGCFDPICSIAASLEAKTLFSCPLARKSELLEIKKKLDNGKMSDHLIFSQVMSLADGDNLSLISEIYMLSVRAVKEIRLIKKQYGNILYSMNFLSDAATHHPSNNINSDNVNLIKAVLCAGLYPNVAHLFKCEKKLSLLRSSDNNFVLFSSKSICKSENSFESPLFVYFDKILSEAVFIQDATMINILPLILFSTDVVFINGRGAHPANDIVEIDGIIQIEMPRKIVLYLKNLKYHLNRILNNSFQNPKILEALHSDIMPDIVQLLSSHDLKVSNP